MITRKRSFSPYQPGRRLFSRKFRKRRPREDNILRSRRTTPSPMRDPWEDFRIIRDFSSGMTIVIDGMLHEICHVYLDEIYIWELNY